MVMKKTKTFKTLKNYI